MAINKLISKKLLDSVHDISSGGILVTLSEMCIKGKIGAKIKIPNNYISPQEYLFGEDQSRYLIEVDKKNNDKVIQILEKDGIFYEILGKTQKDYLDLHKEFNIKIEDLKNLNSLWFRSYFNEI